MFGHSLNIVHLFNYREKAHMFSVSTQRKKQVIKLQQTKSWRYKPLLYLIRKHFSTGPKLSVNALKAASSLQSVSGRAVTQSKLSLRYRLMCTSQPRNRTPHSSDTADSASSPCFSVTIANNHHFTVQYGNK